MNYCVSGRQLLSVIQKADEIRFDEKDTDRIVDFIEDFSKKTVILEINEFSSTNKKLLNTLYMYAQKFANFYLATRDIQLMDELISLEFKAFLDCPINTYYDLRGLLAHNPAQVCLGEPLSFDLPRVKEIIGEIPIRLIANLDLSIHIPHKDGICSSWIRPEDVSKYETFISSLEFYSESLSQEAALFKIYSQDKVWFGNLALLIYGLNKNADNRVLPEDFADKRISCGQRCMKSGNCHACETAFHFAECVQSLKDVKKER